METELVLGAVYRLTYKEPKYLRLTSNWGSEFTEVDVVFFKTTSGDHLCYKAPGSFFGFLAEDLFDGLDSIQMVGEGV